MGRPLKEGIAAGLVRDPRYQPRIAAGATLVVALVAAWVLNSRLPAGDEPHYLVITQSLIKDADLRIENNHRARDYAAYLDAPLAPDFLRRGRDGQIYSIHAPGLPVLVLPAFWLFGYRGAEPTDVAAVEALLVRLGQLVEVAPEIVELDANPVIAGPAGAMAVDVKVRLEPDVPHPERALRRLR